MCHTCMWEIWNSLIHMWQLVGFYRSLPAAGCGGKYARDPAKVRSFHSMCPRCIKSRWSHKVLVHLNSPTQAGVCDMLRRFRRDMRRRLVATSKSRNSSPGNKVVNACQRCFFFFSFKCESHITSLETNKPAHWDKSACLFVPAGLS